ncbi:hypothetical protein [Treponema sp.]|uniref:hypothetical protein n=1 Tax=Treponema sp. TaxID=166 RepID=UPI002580B24C|nr:hypothetical protein [Treponema sp.]
MKSDNIKLQHFDMNNIPKLIEKVYPLWQPPAGDEGFKRLYVEYIIRNNIFKNEYQFELDDSETGAFCAAAFAARKGEHTVAEDWFDSAFSGLNTELKVTTGMCRTYLNLMDSRTFSLMNQEDVKLALFISLTPGYGSEILKRVFTELKAAGHKKVFLWTDCECNWQWYEKHGFDLVEKNIYEPFSDDKNKYATFIFKKTL